MWMLQDAANHLSFNVIKPISTVHLFLKEKKALKILGENELLHKATKVIEEGDSASVASDKKKARESLLAKYTSDSLSKDEILLCLDSISDANSYIIANRHPVDKMINFLKTKFDPEEETRITNLTIRYGSGGSCLSHSHKTQYRFCLQSLLLWREIQHEMFKLWILTDQDLLSESNNYRLSNTGQGLNRVQAAPKISRAMSTILHRVQASLKDGWVGLSVVHLGDRDVPNALTFIDKYIQVPRILAPIVRAVEQVDYMHKTDPEARLLIDEFGGVEEAQCRILRDYYRHGFDGSGSDGGSCVDGRLTSSWNWCSKLEKKKYYHVFMVTGFQGFDGDFRE